MKLIHTSDLHLGSPMRSLLSGSKARAREAELLDGFAAIARYASKEGARGIIISGDLFDSDRAAQRTVEAVLSIIRENNEIIFLVLPGNHEGHMLANYRGKLPENLKLFNTGWTYYEIDGVEIVGAAKVEGDSFSTLRPSSAQRRILVLHGEVRDSVGEGVINLKSAAGKGIDYIALGHYHSYGSYTVDERCTAVYSGTPEGRGFDECGEKGFVVIDIDGRGLKHNFIKSGKRELHTVRLDVSGCRNSEEWEYRAAKALEGIPSSDIVRIETVGRYKIGVNRDTDRLIRRFGHRFYHFEARDNSTLEISAEDYKYDKSIRGEFVRSVMADADLDEKEKGEIISCGLYALEGEAIYEG